MEHRIFNRTFLKQTEVSINFTPAIDSAIFQDKMTHFLKSYFNVDISNETDANSSHLEILSDQTELGFYFEPNRVGFVIGQKSYASFDRTALPMLEKLKSFISDIAKSTDISKLSILKTNIWPIKSEDAYSDFSKMVRYTFQEHCVSDIINYPVNTDNPQPFKLSKRLPEKVVKNSILDTKLSAEIISDVSARLSLTFNASTEQISVSDLISKSLILNDLIYQEFIGTISDNIIDIMSREVL